MDYFDTALLIFLMGLIIDLERRVAKLEAVIKETFKSINGSSERVRK